MVWYQRSFAVPQEMTARCLVHFGAVDYIAEVWLDGQHLGSHEGGYTPFTFDVTDLTEAGKEYTLTVRCEDRLDFDQPRGKQSFRPEPFECWYTPVTGIWQSVWLEGVGEYYPVDFRLTPCLERSSLKDVFIKMAAKRVKNQVQCDRGTGCAGAKRLNKAS